MYEDFSFNQIETVIRDLFQDEFKVVMSNQGIIQNITHRDDDKLAWISGRDMHCYIVGDINNRLNSIIFNNDNKIKENLEQYLEDFAKEREEISKYISKERDIIMADGKILLDDTVNKLMDGVSSMVKKLLIYIILFVFLIVGVPFYIGYKIGNRKNKKEP